MRGGGNGLKQRERWVLWEERGPAEQGGGGESEGERDSERGGRRWGEEGVRMGRDIGGARAAGWRRGEG